MVTVSVIIPNYTRAAVVGETIENMLRQSLPPHEVIVVDDGSTDDSVSVIRSFGDRVILLQQSNQGPGAARNAGLKIATGEFIQFMDSDDLASLNKLEAQIKALSRYQADIVYGPWVKVWMQDHRVRLENVVLQQYPLPSSRHPLHWFLTSWSMVFQQCLIRRSVLEKVGGYREDMKLYEDGELFVRLLLSGAILIHEAQSLTLYRLDDHAKLTASGQQQQHKIQDTALFHQLLIQQLHNYPQFHSILMHKEFQMNVWKIFRDITPTKSLDADLPNVNLEILEPYCTDSHLRFLVWFQAKRKGFQQRLKGHRWPSCYQCGQITSHQQQLIRELSLTIA